MGMNKGREAEGSRGTFFLLPGRLSRERSIWWLVVGRWSCSVFSQDMGNKKGECSGARSLVRSDRAGGCATDRSTF